MEHTTVRVGSPNPTGIVRFEARRNALITSWKADGIIYYSGTMQLDGAIFNCDTGEDVGQVQIPEQVVDEKSDLESDVSETRAYAPYDEASEEAPAQEELLQEEPVLEELSEEEPVLEEPDLEKESYTEQAFDQGLGFDDEFQEEYEEVVAEADTQPEEPSTPETSAQGDVSYDATQDLAPKPIERIDIHHVHLHLHATRPIRFSARVSSDSSNVKIDFEQWTNGSSIITSLNPETPFGGSKYRYIIALRTEAGYAFSKRFQLYYRGKRVTYSAMISNDLRTAMIDWNLTSTVSKPTIAQRMFL